MEFNFIFLIAVPILAFGLYELALAAILKEPFRRTSTKLLGTISRQTKQRDIWLKHPFLDLMNLMTNLVFLQSAEERIIQNKLLRLSLPYTARQYVARGYCGILVGIVLALLWLLVGSPLVSIFSIAVGIWLYLRNLDMVNDRIGELNRLARLELPLFVRTLNAFIGTERDLVRIVKRYLNITGPGLEKDLEILLMDLNTGNIQIALQQFDTRMAIPEVSQLVNILINIDRGVDQGAALANLASTMSATAREATRRELALRPGKLRRAMFPAIFIAILSMFYVFAASVINNVSSLFG